MRIPRFYQAIDVDLGQQQVLSNINHRHAVQVLRLKQDDQLVIFDGNGGEYYAKMSVCNKRDSAATLLSFDEVNRESSLKTSLILSTIKSDKMDFAIQKAVELGVSHIQPMISERSVIKIKAERLEKKMQHWQAIIIGACEQSGRAKIPTIAEPLSLEACLDRYKNLFCMGMLPCSKLSFKKVSDLAQSNIALFIGPEGGFTDNEESLMHKHNINMVNFGNRILRAETAVIAGLTACQLQWGDL